VVKQPLAFGRDPPDDQGGDATSTTAHGNDAPPLKQGG